MIRSGLTQHRGLSAQPIEMPSTSKLSATFNAFLFATVCEERNEMPLSVVSALARLDLDPWVEAAALAQMPADVAAQRLSSMLARAANDPPGQPDHTNIATQLVALLPKSAKTASPPRDPVAGVPPAAQFKAVRIMWLACLASMAVSMLLASLAPGAGASGPAPTPVPSTSARH
jgi:hypothetical protein